MKRRRYRHVSFMDRAEHSTVRAERGRGAKAGGTPWPFLLGRSTQNIQRKKRPHFSVPPTELNAGSFITKSATATLRVRNATRSSTRPSGQGPRPGGKGAATKSRQTPKAKKKDRCLWLGHGLSFAQPSGAQQS